MSALPHFTLGAYNSHYEGSLDADHVGWLAAGANDKADHIAALLGDQAGAIGSVLEVGCGTGAVLLELRRRGIGTQHRGVDYSDPHAHSDPRLNPADLPLDRYDGQRLPYDDASFDLVYATHVLEHVPEEQPFLAELRRVARRFVYVEVPCEITARTTAASLQTTLDIGHLHPYIPESFALELCRAGLPPQAFRLFDHSIAVHSWHGGRLRGWIKLILRRSALRLSPLLASKIFCYHAGALCPVPARAA
jgi:SAM-dependent methyltransferase